MVPKIQGAKSLPMQPLPNMKFCRVLYFADHKMQQYFRRQTPGGGFSTYEEPFDHRTQVNFVQDFPGESSAYCDPYSALTHAITVQNYDAVLSGAMAVRRRRRRSWC